MAFLNWTICGTVVIWSFIGRIETEKQRGGRVPVNSISTPQKQRCDLVCKTPICRDDSLLEGERFPNPAAALSLLWKAEGE